MLSFLPPMTDEIKLRLQNISAEVAQSKVPLKDVTMLLSDAEKLRVRDMMQQLLQQYQNADNILGYFYVLSGNADGAKRLLQLKLMTKNILENLRQDTYLAGPDLIEKMRLQYQKFTDYVKEQILARKAQQEAIKQQPQQHLNQNQNPQGQPAPPIQQQGPAQGMRGAVNGQYAQNNQQYPQNMSQLMPGGYNNSQNIAPPGQPQQSPQVQSMQHGQFNQQKPISQQPPQQYARALPNQNMQPQKLPGAAPGPRLGSSPIPIPGAASPGTKSQPYKATPAKKATTTAANRRKNAKSSSAIPTPASAPTPATLANAIKTPNNMPTPLLPQTHSNRGTPNESSPTNDLKTMSMEKEPFVGDVFGRNSTDFQQAKRRELSDANPEKFFFSALSNLLEIGEEFGGKSAEDSQLPLKSPLSPKHSGEWSAEIKPFALVSAFRQVEAIKDLTCSDILSDCAELVKLESADREANSERSLKRELEEEEDLDLLFVDKKFGLEELAFGECGSLVEFDDWKSWLTKLQET